MAGVRTWIGLTDALFTDNLNDPASRHLAMFRYSSAVGANIYAVTKDGTTINAVSTDVAASSSWFTLRMVSTAGGVDFYVNGVKTNSLTTNLPSEYMIMMIQVMTIAGAAVHFHIGSFTGVFNG